MALQDATLDAIIPTSNREGTFDVCLLAASLVSLRPFDYSRGKLGSRTTGVARFFAAFMPQKADQLLM